MAATTTVRAGAVPAAVYRRRQLVALAILVGVVLALATLAGWLGGGPLPASEPPPSGGGIELVARRTHVVQPGDTLWSIARALQPTGDVRPLVQRLADEHGAALQVGDRISLP